MFNIRIKIKLISSLTFRWSWAWKQLKQILKMDNLENDPFQPQLEIYQQTNITYIHNDTIWYRLRKVGNTGSKLSNASSTLASAVGSVFIYHLKFKILNLDTLHPLKLIKKTISPLKHFSEFRNQLLFFYIWKQKCWPLVG